jgi:hypothetical protein
MTTKTIKHHVGLYAILAAALIAAPLTLRAQDQDAKKTTAAENGSAAAKKHRHLPFHGKTAAVDKTAMTVTVGHMVIHVNSDTKITNNGKPATFTDIVVGEKISGSYEKDAAGKMNARLIHIGGKAKDEGKKKKAEQPAKD